MLTGGEGFNVGEMAHVIAKKPRGPRGRPEGGDDTYANLILLCPTCHRIIDKAPEGEYPEDQLYRWKTEHEDRIRSVGSERKFQSAPELKLEVAKLLIQNHEQWHELGPKSETARSDPGSNLHVVWELRKLDSIVPNNREIINMIEANDELLSIEDLREFAKFKNHAQSFESHQQEKLDSYPRFPESFEKAFQP